MSIYVQNILSKRSGKPVANQFVINVEGVSLFQSYSTVIVRIERHGKVYLDRNDWNCSNTTSKYRNIFLNEDTASTHRKIESGEYTLTNLNNSKDNFYTKKGLNDMQLNKKGLINYE